MKKLSTLLLSGLVMIALIMLAPANLLAQECDGSGKNFVDLDGDGFNDNAPDADGDGIPNGLDDDYVKPGDGEGQKQGKLGETEPAETQTKEMTKTQEFTRLKAAKGSVHQKRIGDATGIDNMGPHETQGECDGSGPKANQYKGDH